MALFLGRLGFVGSADQNEERIPLRNLLADKENIAPLGTPIAAPRIHVGSAHTRQPLQEIQVVPRMAPKTASQLELSVHRQSATNSRTGVDTRKKLTAQRRSLMRLML